MLEVVWPSQHNRTFRNPSFVQLSWKHCQKFKYYVANSSFPPPLLKPLMIFKGHQSCWRIFVKWTQANSFRPQQVRCRWSSMLGFPLLPVLQVQRGSMKSASQLELLSQSEHTGLEAPSRLSHLVNTMFHCIFLRWLNVYWSCCWLAAFTYLTQWLSCDVHPNTPAVYHKCNDTSH